jgi:probable sporulation protein (polysaccharide deacetylase family)
MIKLLFRQFKSLFGSKKYFTSTLPHGQFIFVFYARKLPIIIFLSSILVLGAFGIGLVSHQSRQVFKPEAPITHGSASKKCVSITVNVDWGQEYLPDILEIFKQHHVQATFFITGRWAQENGPLVRKIAAEGQEIGNHGFSHSHVNDLSLDENMDEIRQTDDVLYQFTGRHAKFYAPPYGEYNDTVLAAASKSNLRTVLWSIDTVDWQNPTPQWIVSRIQNMSHNGAIILMHPTPVSVKALPDIITTLTGQGYEIVSLEKLLSE